MRIFSSTPNTLLIIQALALALVIMGVFIVNNMWQYIVVSVILFYCYNVLGIGMMLHRYYTHKSFKLSSYLQWVFTAFAVLAGRGSPLGWVYIHRVHHATSDTEKDPHSPHYDTFKFIGFKPVIETDKKINHFIIRDMLTPAQLKIDQYYLLIVLGFVFLLGLIGFDAVFYLWALPALFVGISQVIFNYISHMYGYRNFNTDDYSTNNVLAWPLVLGDAWHNNHHGNPLSSSTQVQWWEIDPTGFIIRIIKK